MIEQNTINKIKDFVDNRKDIGYQFEPPSGISPSVIIFGEKHTDPMERKDQEDLIKELGLAKFVLLAEDEGYFENWKGKYGCCEVALCDLNDKAIKQIELLRNNLQIHDDFGYGVGVDTFFDRCVERHPYLMKLFYDAREKEMGEIIRSNYSRELSKLIVVIIGHYHARKDSEVHKILEKEKIDYICIWNKKAVKEVEEKYHFFRQNSAA